MIKFRVWCKNKQEWEADQVFISQDGTMVHRGWSLETMLNNKMHVIEQFTGLTDKNGKDIYEGDIVTCKMTFENGSLPHMGEIVYVDNLGAFATKNLCGETLLHHHLLNTFEIIGNIHTTPELLKG